MRRPRERPGWLHHSRFAITIILFAISEPRTIDMISKKFILIGVLIVVVLITVGVWLGVSFIQQGTTAGPSRYSAVYLSTGEVYFGILSWFPQPHLSNVWFLQRSADQNNQPQVGIAPFKGTFWGPVDEIYLSSKQIIFWTRLRNDSQLIKAFDNPDSLRQAQQGQQQPQGQQFPPSGTTSTSRGSSGPAPAR